MMVVAVIATAFLLPIAFNAIADANTTAWNTVMVGFNLVSESEDAKKLVQSYLDKLDIDLILLENVIYTLVYGDSFIEIVKNTKEKLSHIDIYSHSNTNLT